MKSNTKRFPWFWLFYIVYILAAAGLIFYGLTWVWDSLEVYEKTRPVHYMEDALPIFEESETEELQKYLTNQNQRFILLWI